MGSLTLINPTASGRLGASAVGKTYYVSPNGSDSNNGLTSATPWQTIARVNSGVYYPGDKILFQGGQVFSSATGLLLNATNCPNGGGTAANPIAIASYGTGKATLSITSLSQCGIHTINLAWVQISNLNIIGSNTGTYADYHGILLENTTTALLDGCKVVDCSISYFPSCGIFLLGNTSVNSGFTNAQIVNCLVSNCITYGIASGVPGTFTINDNTGGFSYPTTNRSHSNLYVAHCQVLNVIGDNSFRYLCGSGIMLANCSNPLIEYCLAHDCGGGGNNGGGPVGIWFWNCSSGIIQYCEVYNQKTNSTNQDGGGFDIDINCDHCTLQYCYAHDNDAYGVLVFQSAGSNVIRFNLFINNAVRLANEITVLQTPLSGLAEQVYNNTIFSSGTAIYAGTGTTLATFSNNIIVVKSGGTLLNKDNVNPTNIVFQNNAYWELNNTFKVIDGGTTYTSLSAWKAARSQEPTTGGASGGYFGDPSLAAAFAAGTVAAKYPPFGVANQKITSYAPTLTAPSGLLAIDLPSLNMGTRDFNGNTFSQPFTSKAVGAIAVNLSPILSLTGASSANPGINANYTIAVLRPASGSTVVFTPTASGSGTINPTTVTLNSGNSYSASFTVQWAATGSYSVGGSASGFSNPTAIVVTVISGSSNDPTTVQNYIASQLPNIPSGQRSAIATAMISSVSGQSYYATDIVDALASSSTLHWTSADIAMCYALSTDSTPNVTVSGSNFGKIQPYKGATPFTQATSGNRPSIDASGMLFNGVSQGLSAAYSLSVPVGIYVVAKRLGYGPNNNKFAFISSTDIANRFGIICDQTNQLMYYTLNTSGTQITETITDISQNSLLGFVANGASSVGYNGLTGTNANLSGTFTASSIQGLGYDANGAAGSNFYGYIQDVIVNTDPTKALMMLRFLKAYRGL